MKVTADITIQLSQDEALALFDYLDERYNEATSVVESESLTGVEQQMLGQLRDYLGFLRVSFLRAWSNRR